MSDTDVDDYVPLPAGLRKRFYEPVVLLRILREFYRGCGRLSEPDLEGSQGKSLKETYFCFLNKLSQICDTHRKVPLGKTVSAITVLDRGTIEYRLASNQRDEGELKTVTEYLTRILRILGRLTDAEINDEKAKNAVFSEILRMVLVFNRHRIEQYIEDLISERQLDFCIQYAESDKETNKGKSVAGALRSLQPDLEAAKNAPRLDHTKFALHTEMLLRKINTHYGRVLEEYMKKKTPDPVSNPDSPWMEVRHALGRLLSYFIAVKVFISARTLWPRLFVDFSVRSIPSSEPLENPPDIRRNVEGIIKRMTRDNSLMEAYKTNPAQIQTKDLNDRIRKRVQSGNFTPIVHAEVNLLESVLAERAEADGSGDGPLRFFHEAEFGAYIGTSKPTCMLCRFYFEAHPSGVLCRESHGNIYHNWRAPDVRRDDGPEPERLRRQILEDMVKKVRQVTDQAIRQGRSLRKHYDSRDTPSNPLPTDKDYLSVNSRGVSRASDAASRTAAVDIEEVAARTGQINLDNMSTRAWNDDDEADSTETTSERSEPSTPTRHKRDYSQETTPATPQSPIRAKRTKGNDEDDEDDDDGGGALL